MVTIETFNKILHRHVRVLYLLVSMVTFDQIYKVIILSSPHFFMSFFMNKVMLFFVFLIYGNHGNT